MACLDFEIMSVETAFKLDFMLQKVAFLCSICIIMLDILSCNDLFAMQTTAAHNILLV